jgi:predicted dehydrogenase
MSNSSGTLAELSQPGRQLAVGIAGYGVVGRLRRQVVDTHPHMTAVAVCDQTLEGKSTLEDGLPCDAHYADLLERELDVLFVCLPNYLAADVTIAGLERGLHVFCEKPPGRDVADVHRVIGASEGRSSQKLMYGFNHRYHDSVKQALGFIRSGELGHVVDLHGTYGKSAIIKFDSDWRTKRAMAGGGILLDQGIHMVDLMRLFGGEFTEVHSFVSNRYWEHDVEDNVYAVMRTPEGVAALLHSSATQWRHRFHLDVTLSHGAIALSGILTNSKSYGAETITVVHAEQGDAGDPREVMTRYNRDNSWREEIAEFAQAILEDRPVRSGSAEEALRTMELVYRIYSADPEWAAAFGIEVSASPTVGATGGAGRAT